MNRRDPLKWLRANGHDLASLTGQDTAALLAAHALWTLYGAADQDGRDAAIAAARALARAMQEKTRHLIVKVIPCALDWSDEQALSRLVLGGTR